MVVTPEMLASARAGLRVLADAMAASTAPKRYKRHVRFQHGQAVVLNPARRASLDAARDRLARTAREI